MAPLTFPASDTRPPTPFLLLKNVFLKINFSNLRPGWLGTHCRGEQKLQNETRHVTPWAVLEPEVGRPRQCTFAPFSSPRGSLSKFLTVRSAVSPCTLSVSLISGFPNLPFPQSRTRKGKNQTDRAPNTVLRMAISLHLKKLHLFR